MAKYVCDFAQVNSIGQKMCQVASDMTSAVSNYSSKIESDLSSWEGAAKSSFQSTCEGQVSTATDDATYINALGEFIQSAAQSIETLEGELSSLNI